MNQFLSQTEFAVKSLIELATREQTLLESMRVGLAPLEARLEMQRWDFESSECHEDFSDAYNLAAFHRMANTQKEVAPVRVAIAELAERVNIREFSTQSICAAILQVAHQGISSFPGGKDSAPTGRQIAGASVRDIVWYGRNQAMHFEEQTLRPKTLALFDILAREHGDDFSLKLFPRTSRATQVVRLLGWNTYQAYSADMSKVLFSGNETNASGSN